MSGNYEDRRRPPRDTKVTSVTVTVAAIGATPIARRPSTSGQYFTFENAGATDLHIVFGGRTCAAPTATTNGGIIKAGDKVDWYIEQGDTHFNAIAITSNTTLRYWLS